VKKAYVSNLLRKFRLLPLTDKVRFYLHAFQNRKINRHFRKENPDVKLPPDYLLYESFQLHYPNYYLDGFETAKDVVDALRPHTSFKDQRILDWGCGPGRLIRHLPALVGNGCTFYGTDYNQKSIDWCSQNLADINFNQNSLAALLPYAGNFFDIIYGYSIVTHLSEQHHFAWYTELMRVLKPGGVLFLTTQGDNYKVKLTAAELLTFNQGQVVVRGDVKEGHRTYSAFQPTGFMQRLFEKDEVVQHLTPKADAGTWLPQDIWIVRKRN